MQDIHPCQIEEFPGMPTMTPFRGFVHFYHEISQYIMMYHSNPCQTMMASIFCYFSSISSKVLKSPYEFIEKNFTKKL